MSSYLDTNVVYSFVYADAHSSRIENWMARQSSRLIVSDWTKAELYAVVRRRTRGGDLEARAAEFGLADFERFVALQARGLSLTVAAGALAVDLARDPLLKLSAPDALHLACAADAGCVLVTFDQRLAEAARLRGLSVDVP